MSTITTFPAYVDTEFTQKIGIPNSIPVTAWANAFLDLHQFTLNIIGGTVAADYDSLVKIANKISSIETIIGQGVNDGDSLVDTITEILTVFATYPEGTDIFGIINSKLGTADLVNDLTSTVPNKALDSRQGKALFDLIGQRALGSDLTSQIATVNATIAALKAGSAETIASLNTKIGAITAIVGDTTPDGDAFVDTVAELLAVFSTYTEGVDLVTLLAGKVNTTDILNVLTTVAGTTGKALDARQGKVLKDLIDAQAVTLGNKANLSAGKLLDSEIPDNIPRMVGGKVPITLLEEDDLEVKFNNVFEDTNNKLTIYDRGFSSWLQLARAWGSKIISEPLLVRLQDCTTFTLTSGDTYEVYHYFDRPWTVAQLGFFMRTLGVFTPTADRNKMVLYSVDMATKVKTLIGITADTPDMLTVAGAEAGKIVKVPLLVPAVCPRGWYLIGIRYESSAQTTAPVISGKVMSNTSSLTLIDGVPAYNSHGGTIFPSPFTLTAAAPKGGTMPWLVPLEA